MDEEQIRRNALARLEWSTRALYQPADVQRSLYPDFVAVADELALDFGHWLSVATQYVSFSVAELDTLRALDDRLKQLSGLHNASSWTLDALASSSEWSGIREFARRALAQLGWSTAPPPPSPDTFIPSRS